MSNTVRIYQRYLIGSAVPFGSQANVSPECLVCVFLMDKKQIISIKEDEPVQLLLSCLSWVVFFSRSLDLFITSHLSGSLTHIRGLFVYFFFSSDFSRTEESRYDVSRCVSRWRFEDLLSVTREDPGQLWSGWVGGFI